ncbi:ABC transporter ATP-binding protein/permease [Patescibacteria group bacterium]|nr:ABC transporter ATP-binding protein/permease [Patescibacteria group bacterium]
MKVSTKKTLRIYLRHVAKHKFLAWFVFLGVGLGALTGVIVPLFYRDFFNVLTGAQDKQASSETLIGILVIIASLQLAEWAFWRIGIAATSAFESRIVFELSNFCFKYLHRHSFAFFNNNFVGSLVKRVNRFTRAFESILDRIIFNILPLSINAIVIVFILWRTNWMLSFGLIIWIALYIVVNLLFVRFKMKYDIQRSEADTKATGILADTITNNSNVKLFNGYDREVNRMGEANERVRYLRKLTWDLSSIFEAVQGLLFIILEVSLFYLAIQLWIKNIFTLGDFVLLQAYVLTLILRIWDFGKIIRNIYEDLADAEEMTEILETPHEITDIRRAKKLSVNRGEIIFENVEFYYNETRKILSDFSLKIAAKEKVALVGSSGAGKTTIVKLILRMFDIDGGKILVDGQDIGRATQESLWKNISMVPQDPVLFHRTLMENIRYGKPNATDKEVVRASKLAHCHEFICGFPEGYETFVGERGMKLSGGERQRVAIARAILRNAPILILDEATSSLDSESESLIQDALNHLMKNKTVIVIAHRLSTIMKMDRIVLVEGGKIFEQGTHAELVKKESGIYKKLWSLQAGGFIK